MAAQFNVAVMYEYGRGVEKNVKESAKWYKISADQGLDKAEFHLAVMYSNGQGVLQDYKEAFKWFLLAAENGNSSAQHNLALMYGKGQGVSEDIYRLHMWLNIAASNGNQNSYEAREKITKTMTSDQINKAKEMAQQCVEKKFKSWRIQT